MPVTYLSYSAFKLFEQDPEAYYLKYLSKNKPPRQPQNHHMAVGSSVDAFIKSELYRKLIGKDDPAFELQALFEAQVEPPQRDQAYKAGKILFETYETLGGLTNLLAAMKDCIGEPKFEKEIVGPVEGVTILGKPDVHYIHKNGCRVIHDFKAQGYWAQTKAQPKPGYLRIRPGGTMSRGCLPIQHRGFEINAMKPMNVSHLEWAEQLAMYAWVLGEEVGSDFILTIDHFCCDQSTGNHRLAWYAAICESKWQREFFERLKNAWTHIISGHIFLNNSREESDMRCNILDGEKINDPLFGEMTRVR